ncbi:MAG: CopG family transcriptional regulator [Propionibacteriaceae bacterium]|nr:CopG family transcriptional regulator [Propionibacteriaceae bacterium]
MRTTITIDDDVLEAVKERARAEGRTAGETLSDLARRELSREGAGGIAGSRNGFPLLGTRVQVTNEMVDDLREQENL